MAIPATASTTASRPRTAGLRIAWALALLLALCVAAAADDDGPTGTLRTMLDKASAIGAGDKSHDQELAAVREVARALVDTRAMGRRALTPTFATLTAAQQEEFLRLFDELVVRSYLQKLLLFRQPTFRFGKEERHGDAVVVATEVVTSKDAYEVTYEMHQRDGRWLATDIVVEGISMTSNYSDQFASLLRDRSFDDLLDLMRRKVDHFRGTEEK